MQGIGENKISDWGDVARELVMGLQFHDRSLVACYGLSVSQCHTLLLIGRAGPLTMGDVARRLYLTPSTMTRIVDQLRKKHLVVRVRLAQDRRKGAVALTPAGRDLYGKVEACFRDAQHFVMQGIPAENQPQVLQALANVVHALRRWHSDCCQGGRISVGKDDSSLTGSCQPASGSRQPQDSDEDAGSCNF